MAHPVAGRPTSTLTIRLAPVDRRPYQPPPPVDEHYLGRAGDGGTGPTDEDVADEQYDPKDEETVKTIKELLDTRVRPAVANDGGDITFHGFKDGVVYLHMRGACSGCPSSTATLRHGIENLLKHFCPDVQEVRPV